MARKILLADDSVTAQNMGRKILTDAGYEVMTVNNGSAALKRVTEQRPDLIVLDVYMPGYSGLEVCQRLKDSGETSRIPILLTVGKLEPFKPEDARRVSADAFIVKPFEASELLSALTRLEDRIVPNGDSPRFSNTVSGIERFVTDTGGRRARETADSGDTGWKSRIRFPSKKPKVEEPEAEDDFATTPSFRDFRKGSTKTPAAAAPPTPTPPPEEPVSRQEPGLVSDLPHDITPDELDALSALVAKLDGPMPQAEEIAPIGDKIGAGSPAEPKSEKVEVPPEAKAEVVAVPEDKAEAAAPSSSEPEVPASSVVDAAPTVAAAETAPAAEEPAAITEAVTETKTDEAVATTASAAPEMVVAPAEETPAPVDQDDEPFFATAASAVPELSLKEEAVDGAAASSEPIAPPHAAKIEELRDQPTVAESAPAHETEAPPPVSAVPEEEHHRSQVEEMIVEAVAEEAVSEEVAEELKASEDHVPSDEELAEALRLLTPVRENTSEPAQDTASLEHPESSAGAGHFAPVQAHAGNGSRWLAEAVKLSSEEMSVSLEAEMFRSLAPVPVAPPSAIAAAATDVLAASSEPGAHIAAAQPEASSETPAEVATATPATTTEEPVAEQPAKQVPESAFSAPQDPVAATFASHDVQDETPEIRNSNDAAGEVVSAPAVHAASELDTNPDDMGDQEDMSKDAKTGKSSKSGWHQIRAAAAPPKEDVVEAAKHGEAGPAEESPKAMAAAAASDDASPAAATDPNAIASIVDSVLADLRPRIVEEIARKLGKK